jgi:hypothetical protein
VRRPRFPLVFAAPSRALTTVFSFVSFLGHDSHIQTFLLALVKCEMAKENQFRTGPLCHPATATATGLRPGRTIRSPAPTRGVRFTPKSQSHVPEFPSQDPRNRRVSRLPVTSGEDRVLSQLVAGRRREVAHAVDREPLVPEAQNQGGTGAFDPVFGRFRVSPD